MAGKPGVPKLRGAFKSPASEALALDYIAGKAPRPRHEGALPAMLWPWVDAKRTVTLSETPEWRRLEAAAAGGGGFWPALAGRLRARALHPAIGHGDLAPWNIKISPQGHWTALDWERGEETGIAGWDWFHYVIQARSWSNTGPWRALSSEWRSLLDSEPFQRYAAHTGIAAFERELVLAYLLHSAEVIKPAEGLPETRELIGALAAAPPRRKC